MSDFFASILNIDEQSLLFINGLNTPFLDIIMWQISAKFIWLPLYLFLIDIIFRNLGWKKGVICLIMIGMLILSMDQLCASFLRPLIGRIRPSSPLNPISAILHFVNDSRVGTFGFPSSHAANTFALAAFISLILRKKLITFSLIIWASIISISRIYLGFHYPTDVMAGAFIGIGLAYIFYKAYIAVIRAVPIFSISEKMRI